MSESDTIPHGFRQIPGFPRYAIDENGMVLSICGHRGGANRIWADAIRVKQLPDTDGYYRVSLSHNGREQTVNVHRLVLTTFVGPCPDGMQCRHLDGNQTNNHVANLAWGTKSQNELDKNRHGTVGLKLKADDVLEIRRRAESGELQREIAKYFCLHVSNVSRIVRRKAWKHV